MSSPIATTPEQTLSTAAGSQPQGPPSTCPSESSQALSMESQHEERPNQGRNLKPRAPPGHSMEEMYAAFYAKMAEDIALQELWFSVMNIPIPGYPDIKPPPKTSLTLKSLAADVNKPRYPGRRYNRQGRNFVNVASAAVTGVKNSEVKDSEARSSA